MTIGFYMSYKCSHGTSLNLVGNRQTSVAYLITAFSIKIFCLGWTKYNQTLQLSNYACTCITRFLSHILLIELSLQGLVLSDAIDL